MTIDKTITQSPFIGGTSVTIPTVQQTFNSSTNYTVPNNVSGIWIHLVGGGAGGSGKNNSYNISGSGGAGGVGHLVYTPVTPGSTVGITIGAGGNGGTPGVEASARYGNDGGATFVNTSGASYGAGGGLRNSSPDSGNRTFAPGWSGPFYGLLRQQIVFGSANQSPRRYLIINGQTAQEGGLQGTSAKVVNADANTVGPAQYAGPNTKYGGAAGGNGASNGASSQFAGNGGGQELASYTGGTGAAWATTNSGGGGGGAGIAGNGGNGSGATGGAGGAGGGGGGGGGAGGVNNTNASGGAGGAGCVKIYY